MATRKTTHTKANTLRKTKANPSRASKYSCDNPPRTPMGVADTVRLLLEDPAFARFLSHQLFLFHKGDAAAQKCVESYYSGPTEIELDEMGVPKKERHRCMLCTDHLHFIDGAAFYAGTRKRKKKH